MIYVYYFCYYSLFNDIIKVGRFKLYNLFDLKYTHTHTHTSKYKNV